MNSNDKSDPVSHIAPRRKFFRLLFSEALGVVEEVKGRPQMRLSELDQVPDSVIRQMTPVFNQQSAYVIEDDRVVLRHPKIGDEQEVYHLDDTERTMLTYFDGFHTVDVIAHAVACDFEDDAEAAYQHVKALFLCLARYFICFPAQAHNDITYSS